MFKNYRISLREKNGFRERIIRFLLPASFLQTEDRGTHGLENKNRIGRASLQLCFLFIFIQIGLLIFFWKNLPPKIPLFYSRSWGEKQLAAPNTLWLLPIISLVIVAVNFFLASLIIKEEKLLGQMLFIFSIIFNFLCLFTLTRVIILVA